MKTVELIETLLSASYKLDYQNAKARKSWTLRKEPEKSFGDTRVKLEYWISAIYQKCHNRYLRLG
jgi:hypothetical protein